MKKHSITPHAALRLLLLAVVATALTACSETLLGEWTVHKDARSLALSTQNLTFSDEAQTKTFSVTAQNMPWQLQHAAAWLSFSPQSGTASAQVRATVQANVSDTARTAFARLLSTDPDMPRSYDLSVRQTPAEAYLRVSVQEVVLVGGGGSQTVDVESNRTWTATSADSWLSVERQANSIVLTAGVNEEAAARETDVHLTSGTLTQVVHVIQRAAGISSTTAAMSFSHEADQAQMTLTSEAAWRVEKTQDWIHVTPTSGEAGEATLTVSVTENTSTDLHRGYIYIYVGNTRRLEVEVIQKGWQMMATPEQLSFEPTASVQQLSIQGNAAWRLDASDPSWLHLSPDQGTGSQTVSVMADNNSGPQRSNTLTLRNVTSGAIVQTIQVVQASSGFTIMPDAIDFNRTGGEKSIYIQTDQTDRSWRITASDAWIGLNRSSGMGNAEVQVTVGENPTSQLRSGQVEVRRQDNTLVKIIPVSQSASEVVESVLDLYHTFLSAGESLQVTAFEQTGWTATVLDGHDWITLSAEAGEANQPLTITTGDNPSGNARTGRIRIQYGLVAYICPVVQAGKTLVLSTSRVEFFAKGGASAAIIATADKAPLVSPGAWWLKVEQDGQTFRLVAEKNERGGKNDGYAREATVTVSLPDVEDSPTATITVTQAGVTAGFQGEGYDEDKDWN